MNPADSPPARDVPVAVPGDLMFIKQPGLLAYAGAFTVTPAGFEFSVRITADIVRRPELEPQLWALHPDRRERQTWLEVRSASGGASPGTDTPQDVRLEFLFGESQDGCSDTRWWVSPLLPPGPVEFTLHLPGQAASVATLDTTALLDAVAAYQPRNAPPSSQSG